MRGAQVEDYIKNQISSASFVDGVGLAGKMEDPRLDVNFL